MVDGKVIRRASFVACAFLYAAPALADDAGYRLAFVRSPGAEACPDEASWRAMVRMRVGKDPFVADSSSAPSPSSANATNVMVRVSRGRSGYEGEIQVTKGADSSHDDRRLRTDASCEELLLAMALVVSVMIRPDLAFNLEEQVTGSAATVPPLTVPPHADSSGTPSPGAAPSWEPKRSQRQMSEPVRFRLMAAVTGSFGDAPSLVAGGLLGAQLRSGMWSALLEAHATLEGSRSTAGGRVASSSKSGALLGCAHYRGAFGCLGVLGGVVDARGLDVSDPHTDRGAVVAADIRLGGAVPAGEHWQLVAFGEVLPLLMTPNEIAVNGQSVYEYPPLILSAGAGVAYRF